MKGAAVAPDPREENVPAVNACFHAHALDVRADGFDVDAEYAGDLWVGLAFGQPAADLLFTNRKVRNGCSFFRYYRSDLRRVRNRQNRALATGGLLRTRRFASSFVPMLHRAEFGGTPDGAVSPEVGRRFMLGLPASYPLECLHAV